MYTSIFACAALLSVASAHSQILMVQGTAGSPVGQGFEVDNSIARNCTSISPCQQDATIIRDAEIAAKTVDQCGRTELAGSINVANNTESAIAAGTVTHVTAGGTLTMTIHQVNADGAGPYTCDLDQTSDTGTISSNLTVTNNVAGVNGLSAAKTQDFNMTITMPTDLACTGASTGNVCTVRCRNNSVAGPFGGCVAVMQTDTTATSNSAAAAAPSSSSSAAAAKATKAAKGGAAAKAAKAGKNNNKARSESALKWASRFVSADSWEGPSN